MSLGIEATLKQLIELRVLAALRELEDEPTPKEIRAIMEVATGGVYDPILTVIKELGAESGVVLQNANSALLLPDTVDKTALSKRFGIE